MDFPINPNKISRKALIYCTFSSFESPSIPKQTQVLSSGGGAMLSCQFGPKSIRNVEGGPDEAAGDDDKGRGDATV